jgi:glycosyltransferase involved in cell wall biosynthesis
VTRDAVLSWNILQISGAAEGGSWFVDQVTELRARGHRVHAVVPGTGSVERGLRAAGVPTSVVPFRGYHPRDAVRLLRAQLAVDRMVRRGGFDIVHAHLLKTIVVSRLAVRGRRRPALVSQMPGVVHLQSRPLAAIDRWTMRRDDLLVASCTDFARQYRARGARAVAVNHYGFHTSRFDPDVPADPFREEQRLPPGQPAVGMVAHMYPTRLKAFRGVGVKGHETFIDAAADLVGRGLPAVFFVVGDEFAGDGSYRRRLEARVRSLGMADRVRFLGHRTDMPQVLAGLDVLVNPSLSESASYTMMEASLMRRPVVATRVGGLVDTVLDGRTGLLVPPARPAELADAIERLARDPGLRARLGAAGRQHVLASFDISRTVDGLEELYRSVMERRDA